jgi:hypothetical protein
MIKHPANLGLILEIRPHNDGIRRFQLPLEALDIRPIAPVMQNQLRVFGGEALSYSCADGTGRSRDCDNFSSKIGFHRAKILHFRRTI